MVRTSRVRGTVTVLLATVLALCAGACGGTVRPIVQGGCAAMPTYSYDYEGIDCAEPRAQRVLAVHSDLATPCLEVAGTTTDHTNRSPGVRLCLAEQGSDPAKALNGAQVGDCLTEIHGESDPTRVRCEDDAARFRVLQRGVDGTAGTPCGQDGRGSTTSHEWRLAGLSRGDDGEPLTDLHSIRFCLGLAPAHPGGSPDTADVGDCLRQVGDDTSFVVADCAGPDATHHVVDRLASIIDADLACRGSGATVALQMEHTYGSWALDGYTLCLRPA